MWMHRVLTSFILPKLSEWVNIPPKHSAQKPNSSISWVSSFKESKIDAFASNGNTGAMLVGSMFSVKAISGVIRPCIASADSERKWWRRFNFDVGTNADCKPDVLYQFGVLVLCMPKMYTN
jgi:glycerol-3-phosphate acyltransferase PlsX